MAIQSSTDVRLLPVGRLKVDHAYQRKLDEAWVAKLSDRWRPELAGVLLVSSRDNGEMVVLDGQHRLAAVRKLLAEHAEVSESVWAEVYFHLSPEDEAAIFMGRNTQKAVHIIDRFRARVAAGEPTAIRINQILKSHGSTWDYNSARGYACVGVLEKVDGWGTLDSTIHILEDAWPNGAFGVAKRKRQVVEGLGIFVAAARGRYGFTDDIAIERLGRRVNVAALLDDAKRDSYGTSVNQAVIVARRLREAYNRNAKLRVPEIIPPKGYRG